VDVFVGTIRKISTHGNGNELRRKLCSKHRSGSTTNIEHAAAGTPISPIPVPTQLEPLQRSTGFKSTESLGFDLPI
jgi:hypothetical protein